MRAENENNVIDPLAEVSTPLRENMRGKHENVTITTFVLDFTKDFFEEKYRNFEKLTGAKVQTVVTRQSTWYPDVLSDITDYENGFIDLYVSFGNWISSFADLGGLKDITSDVMDTVGLDWFDIMPAVRNGVATYKQKIFGIPLDGDVILMLYRKDLVEDVGLPTPNTWDDVMKILEYYEEDENLYGNCLPSAENDISGEIFFSIASSFLQTKGTSEGVFFDPVTMEPVTSSRKEEFVKVLEIYKKIIEHSPYRDMKGPNGEGVNWITNLDLFNQGRCVLWYNYPGPTRLIISNQADNNLTGTLDLAPLPGMKCDNTVDCPFASEDGANHAPYLASGGLCMAVNNRTTPEQQAAALDLAFYMSDPSVSYWDVAYPGSFLDPLRQRHTASLGNKETKESQSFLSYGWEERQLKQLKDTTEFNFLHENYVYDLRVLGANEYREKGLLPHLLLHWFGVASASQTADAITKSWNEVTEKYGLKEQRSLYRSILDLPAIEDDDALSTSAILSFVIPIGLIVIILLVIVMKQRHVIKYKTRDVNSAPKSGHVALLFTDIEGSTSLWDTSKSAMSRALEIHHNIIRECIYQHKAYEVKTIGDAFMIATNSADKACLLANDIQLKLLRAPDWPLELATHPSSCVSYFVNKRKQKRAGETGNVMPKPMFKGLRVRIGIHMGLNDPTLDEGNEVQIMYDKITKGYDYYGPVSNAAARIESLGFGGQNIISDEVFNSLSQNVRDKCSIKIIGDMELRGVSGTVCLYELLPEELKGRVFNGAYRKRDSTASDSIPESISGFDSAPSTFFVGSGRSQILEEDKNCDVYALTPIELQHVARRLQDRVVLLERRLSGGGNRMGMGGGGGEDTSCTDTNLMMSEISFEDLPHLNEADEETQSLLSSENKDVNDNEADNEVSA